MVMLEIWEGDFNKFHMQTDKGVAEILDYLKHFRGSKAKREEAETLGRYRYFIMSLRISNYPICIFSARVICVTFHLEAGHPLTSVICAARYRNISYP